MAKHPIESHDGNEPNDFVRSVIELSPDDIVTDKPKRRSPLAFLSDHLRLAVLLLCLAVLIASLGSLVETFQQYDEGEELYDSLGDLIAGNSGIVDMMYSSPQSTPTPDYAASQKLTDDQLNDLTRPQVPVINKEYERVRSQLVTLKKQYPDLYGWIILEGTIINYPIMQSTDNEYYLNRSYKGTKLKAGSIYADYRCDRTLMNNKNLVIYGHHMVNQTMFNSLDNFLSKSFFENNNIVRIYTLDGMFTYQVFSVYETHMYYPYITTYFATDEDVNAFFQRIHSNSIHPNSQIQLDAASRVLTMTTCTNRSKSGRLAVHAVMIDAYLVNP